MARDTVHILEELLKGCGSELRRKEDWLRELQAELQNDGQEMVIVLLQGPRKTLEGLRLLFRNMSMEWNNRVLLLVEVLTHKVGALEDEHRNKKRKYDIGAGTDGEITSLWISHEMVGGVVGEKWKVRINRLWNEQVVQEVQRQTEVMAQAADYLSTTERGNTIKPPTMGQEIKILWKQRTVWVCATNVFSSTGWVRRLATVRELMAMYDMGESEIRVVSERILERNSTFTEFTQQVPVRVLSRLLKVLGKNKKMHESVVLAKNQFDEQGSCMSDSGRTRNVAQLGKLKDGGWEKQLVMEYLRDVEPSKVMREQTKLLAKNDDAEVKVGEWNERVCNGLGINYCPTIHDKALDVLRKLLLVRYRSYRFGVIGSFRRYMKEKYGTEWLRDMRISRKRRRGAIKEIVLD